MVTAAALEGAGEGDEGGFGDGAVGGGWGGCGCGVGEGVEVAHGALGYHWSIGHISRVCGTIDFDCQDDDEGIGGTYWV